MFIVSKYALAVQRLIATLRTLRVHCSYTSLGYACFDMHVRALNVRNVHVYNVLAIQVCEVSEI